MINYEELEGLEVELMAYSEPGKIFSGIVGDYVSKEDNYNGEEAIILDNVKCDDGREYILPVEFKTTDIYKLVIKR